MVETLEAQLPAAERRVRDLRPTIRAPLGRAHSALAFVPALGAVHGLSTGGMNYFRIVSIDLLHVRKLGMLRTFGAAGARVSASGVHVGGRRSPRAGAVHVGRAE